MATRGDEKERGSGQHDDVELTPGERASFDQASAGLRESDHSGYTRRDWGPELNTALRNTGYKKDQDDNAGYTMRATPKNDVYDNNGGFTRRFGEGKGAYKKRRVEGLKDAEESGDTGRGRRLAAGGVAGLMNSERAGNDTSTPFSYKGNNLKGRGFAKRNKKLLLGLGIAGIGFIPLLALLVFLLGALKIPHFVENMAVWRFAGLTRQYRFSVNNVMNEKNALDALDDDGKTAAAARYGKYKAFDNTNRLRPNRVLARLEAENRLQYKYRTTLTGKQKLTEIVIAPEENSAKKVTIKVPAGRFDKLIHPFRTLDQYNAINTALNGAMKATDPKIPTITRSLATRQLIGKFGGTMRGLAASKFVGKSDRAAKITIQRTMYEMVNDKNGANGLKTQNTKDIAKKLQSNLDTDVANDTALGDAVDRGTGIPDKSLDDLEKGLSPDNAKNVASKVIGFANPVYNIAVPVCMVYEGSKLNPDAINANQNAMMRESTIMLSVADQQKDGTQFSTQTANAMNWKMGDIQDSMAMRRVSGKPADTTATVGGQRTTLGTYGQYTIFDVILDGNGGVFNSMADDLCPVMTNIWVGIGLGVANLATVAVTSLLSGGAAGAAEAAATQSATRAVTAGLKRVVEKHIKEFTLKKGVAALAKTGRFGKQYAKDVIKWGVATAAATYIARMIVLDAAGTLNSGLETKAAFLDNVDNGTQMLSSEMGRANFKSRPLNNAEAVQAESVDRAEIHAYYQNKSTFERYLALENPNSMATRMATTAASLANKSIFSTLLNSVATLFNPIGLSSKVFASTNGQVALAAGSTNNYGNIRADTYSIEEQRLMQQDSYASPSENEKVLDDSGKEGDIASEYDKCFTEQFGTLLANGDIVRNESGDVLNEGDCSPEQLGPHNPTYGDLVFRWRLKHDYDTIQQTLLGIQDPTKRSNSNAVTGSVGTLPTGSVQELAKQVLNNPNISFQVEPTQRKALEYIAETGKARNCGNKTVSPKLLSVLLAAAAKYKIVVGVLVDGHGCDDDSHPLGLAADLNGVNPLSGSGGTGRFITPQDYRSNALLKKFYEDIGDLIAQSGGGRMGQHQCFNGAAPKNSNLYYFNDACNHLHIDVKK